MGPEIGFLVWMQNNLRFGIGDVLFSSVAISAVFYVLVLLIGLLLVMYKPTRIIGAAVLIGVGLTMLLGDMVIGIMANRPRPVAVYPYFEQLIPASSSSFPSGSVAGLFATATAIFFYKKKWSIPVFVYGILVGFSQLYCYVNYPTDIVAGAIIGVICGSLAYIIVDHVTDIYAERIMNKGWNGNH